jgi:hypothetical protein
VPANLGPLTIFPATQSSDDHLLANSCTKKLESGRPGYHALWMVVTATRSGPGRARLSQNFLFCKIDNVIANALIALRVVTLGLFVVLRIPVDRFTCKSQRDGKSAVRRCASMNDAILIAIAFNVGERIELRRAFSEFFGNIRRRTSADWLSW